MMFTEADRKLLDDAGKDSDLMAARVNEIWVIACLAVSALDAFETGKALMKEMPE
jgi:hypothetical protein